MKLRLPASVVLSIVLPLLVLALIPRVTAKKIHSAEIPEKIVSLSPSISRMIADLGKSDSVIGVTSYDSTFPKRAIIGSIVNPNAEAILRLHPDLILYSTEDAAVQRTELFQSAKIRTAVLDSNKTFDDILLNYQKLADILGVSAIGKIKSTEYRNALENKTDINSNTHPRDIKRVLFLLSHDPIIASSSESFIGSAIRDAGAECIVGKTGNPYPLISREFIAAGNPDILISTMENPVDDITRIYKNFSSLSFIKNNTVFCISPETACYYTPRDYITTVKLIREFCASARGGK